MAELDLKVGKTFVAWINTNPEMTPMQARRMRSSMREYPVRFRSPSFLRERTFISTPQQNSATFPDRKSTRLNSSHQIISYAVFCLKKKKQPKKVSHIIEPNLYIISHSYL